MEKFAEKKKKNDVVFHIFDQIKVSRALLSLHGGLFKN